MEPREYENEFFRKKAFRRQTCKKCGEAFWSETPREICAEDPCTPYSFIGKSPFSRSFTIDEFREFYLRFFEQRGHTRVRRYPTVPRWRDDVLFVQASIYDFQPWVTSGAIEPPANPLVISQPCLRFNDIGEVGVSGRHLTSFEMLAHHAFNKPGNEIYFKDRTVELCHELLTSALGVPGGMISYKEEVWEGGGDLGPSLSVGVAGLELATLVFMQYARDGDSIKPLPLKIVDTGYGLERFVWTSQGTPTIYEAVFDKILPRLPSEITPPEAALLVDHARNFSLIVTDGVVPSNVKEGYLARLLLRRMMRTLDRHPGVLSLHELVGMVVGEVSKSLPEIGRNQKGLLDIVDVEETRFRETLARGREHVRRLEGRLHAEGKKIGLPQLLELYDSMGLTPDVVLEELKEPIEVPRDFYASVAKLHEKIDDGSGKSALKAEETASLPDPPHSLPPTEVLYQLDPYTVKFTSRVLWTEGPWVILEKTYFYPTGGGQITDTGHMGDRVVDDVVRRGPFVMHHIKGGDGLSPRPGETVECAINEARRRQLMQHHTATHLLNGAMRHVLGPHIWQAGAYKGVDGARLDVTHYRSITDEEVHKVERLVNRMVRENHPVKSYFSPRKDAEERFGFILYQGGAVPGKVLRIVEIEGFDTEACGGTHCTHTSEVGLVKIVSTERIQDGMVRLNFVAGEKALDVVEEQGAVVKTLSQMLASPQSAVVETVENLLQRLRDTDKASRSNMAVGVRALSDKLLSSKESAFSVGGGRYVAVKAMLGEGQAQLKDLARELTKEKKVIALLGMTEGEKGTLFLASGSPDMIPAIVLLNEAKKVWQGRGGGNASAATASGPSGESLSKALEAAFQKIREIAGTVT
jgi:alanyl-tRNA synthetase